MSVSGKKESQPLGRDESAEKNAKMWKMCQQEWVGLCAIIVDEERQQAVRSDVPRNSKCML